MLKTEAFSKVNTKQIYFLLSLSIECSVGDRGYANEHIITNWIKGFIGNAQGVEREIGKQ